MKSNIAQALRLTLICLAFFAGLYSLLMWAIAQIVGPNQGRVEFIESKGRPVGCALIGQTFTDPKYFWSRPSAVDYNAAGSAGSNKGPTNADYLGVVKNRIDTFALNNSVTQLAAIPADMVTASGSGLDPHVSKQAILLQVQRVARARGMDTQVVNRLVDEHTTGAFLGLFGPKDYVHVLELNVALDNQ